MFRTISPLLALTGLMFALHLPARAQTPGIADSQKTSGAIRYEGSVAQVHSTWSDYGGASDASQYSALSSD